MEDFIGFFTHLTPIQKVLWITACLTFFWLLEGAKPLFGGAYKKWSHAGKNLIFLGFTMIINLVMGALTAGMFAWGDSENFGLLKMVEWPWWLELLITVMWIDLIAQYTVHYFLHKVKWMWKFHMVHHSDTMVDATTGTRHHPGDYLIREVLALVATVALGAPFAYYMFYRMSSVLFTYFSHANIRLPDWLDKSLSLVFITPNVHKFHHHFERPWTDTNFGNIFSFWDRIFGTLVYDDPKKVKYGLDVLDDATAGDVKYQLKLPFNDSIKTDY
jgi:sterol desaturase/sphingolipid hydroxylase (fatty acid hydroxylase superfamily)